MPIFAFFVIFAVWLAYEIKKNDRIIEARSKEFWNRESESNSVRRKDISNLDYITIPFDELPFDEVPNQSIANYQSKITKLKEQKILNLTGYTNTDLKLMYGAANLTDLTDYDTNFTTLVANLGFWAKSLYEIDKDAYHDSIVTIASYSISIGSDVASTYKILASIYLEEDKITEIYDLLDKASDLKSLNKDVITGSIRQMLES